MAITPSNPFGPDVPAAKIKQLSDNYSKHLHIKRQDGSVTPHDPAKDTKSIWFSKAAIDKLFADNGYTGDSTEFGLRVYLGMHDKSSIITDIPDHAHHRLTVVLVATKGADNPVDLLHAPAALSRDGGGDSGGGVGLNHGKMCPPEICGGV